MLSYLKNTSLSASDGSISQTLGEDLALLLDCLGSGILDSHLSNCGKWKSILVNLEGVKFFLAGSSGMALKYMMFQTYF